MACGVPKGFTIQRRNELNSGVLKHRGEASTPVTDGGVASMSKQFGKTDFKRMRYPVHVILMALSMFYLGKIPSATSL
jgi:hypothetical protein